MVRTESPENSLGAPPLSLNILAKTNKTERLSSPGTGKPLKTKPPGQSSFLLLAGRYYAPHCLDCRNSVQSVFNLISCVFDVITQAISRFAAETHSQDNTNKEGQD